MHKRKNLLALVGASIFVCGIAAWAMKAPATNRPATSDLKAANSSAAAKVAIDQKVAAFTLPDADGKATEMRWDKNKATVLLFVSTRCPVSNAYNQRMAAIARNYAAKGVTVYGINANKAEDAPSIKAHAQQNGFDFVVLKDKGNIIADRFDAQVTPEAYVIDNKGTLRYHGRIDDSQNADDIQSHDLKAAVDAVLTGKTVPAKETRAFGCGIKRAN